MVPAIGSAASRHITHRARSVSCLSRLSADCLSKLKKTKIDHSTRSQLEKLDIEYRGKLHEEVESEYAAIPGHSIFTPDDSPEAEERAVGFQLSCALWSVMKFQESYSVSVPHITLEAAMNPSHRRYLVDAFHNTWQAIDPDEKRALLTALSPDTCHQLDLPLSDEERKISLNAARQGLPQLQVQHVLALTDYCNSQTGNFNPVNDAMRLWQLCGSDKMAEITECLRTPLNEALSILWQHKAFIHEGPAYKGISLANGAGQFRLSWMQPGGQYTNPHWCSATSREEANYASDQIGYDINSTNDRDTQLTIVQTRGVKVHLFNDVHTMQQKEVMLPPRPMLFVSPHEVDQKKFPPNWLHPTIYCVSADENL